MSLLWLILFASLLHRADPVCQFQNPFYFIDRPSVVTVVDSSGQMVADRSERIIRDVILMTMRIIPILLKLTYHVSYYCQGEGELGSGAELPVCGLFPN